MALHMIRLCVGCDTIDELIEWQTGRGGPWLLHTRQTPKRADELVDGGSIYRIFKGMILCRQAIIEVRTLGSGPSARCEIVLDPEIVRVVPTPRRAFQGWRYLQPADAPADLAQSGNDQIPDTLARQLREAGAW